MSIEMTKAIYSLRPNSEFSFENNDYSTIQWDVLEGDAPTLAEVQAAIKEIKNQELSNKIARDKTKAALFDRLGITQDEAHLLLS